MAAVLTAGCGTGSSPPTASGPPSATGSPPTTRAEVPDSATEAGSDPSTTRLPPRTEAPADEPSDDSVAPTTTRTTRPDGPAGTLAPPPTATPPPETALPVPTATTEPPACAPQSDFLVTSSGRRVLLRAAGVRPHSPLVLILHGYTGTPTGIETFAEFTALGNGAGVAVAFPEGTPTPTEGFGWASGAAIFATAFVDDVGALLEMIDVIVATGCVDPTRVVIAGESNGAGMALALACDSRSAGRLAAVVMVNAAIDEGVMARCAGGAPVALPLSAVAGEIDRTVPYEGGRGLLGQDEWWYQASVVLAGCVGFQSPTPIDDWTRFMKGIPCETCSVLFTVGDGTHTWPGTSRGTGGLRPGTFDLASRLLWIAASPPPLRCLPL